MPGYNVETFYLADSPSFKGHPISKFVGKTVQELGLKHGDLLFATIGNLSTSNPADKPDEATVPITGGVSAKEIFRTVKQSPVDDKLEKLDGKIQRPRDNKMCKHGDKGMCEYCMPLEPYDLGYQEEHKIKHLSFHAYLRKLNAQANKQQGSSYMAPLDEPDYTVAKKCPSGHPAWPDGICSKCQPSAITLQQQSFRLVDHVEFSSSSIVDTFINSWRQTGEQRIGYLYGRYEQYEGVPLGIKAVVEAIYEPPQQDDRDGVTLSLPWNEEKDVDKMASLCGLQKVGVIFTDLLDAGEGTGSVVCKRHIDSYFLSSLEICFAAELQRRNPNPSKWSITGQFSSKFVTCVISGNVEKNIDISTFQVSTSAEAMVKADLIEPSVNPAVMRIKEPSKTRYVPDIFYSKINEYKRKVQENAKPAFPVEYLLVTLTHGFPETESSLFSSSTKFPIENRANIGTSQDIAKLASQLGITRSSFTTTPQNLQQALSDFHLLNYIHSLGILSEDEERVLATVATGQVPDNINLLVNSPGWNSLITIIQSSL